MGGAALRFPSLGSGKRCTLRRLDFRRPKRIQLFPTRPFASCFGSAYNGKVDRQIQDLTTEERFHLLLDCACDYAIFFTLPNGDICEWSSGAEKMMGYSEEEAVQLNGSMIFTPGDREKGAHLEEMATALAEGQANDERWHLRKDGSYFFAIGRLVALRDATGRHRGFAKIIRDVTPTKRLQDALQATELQLRTLFSQAPWGIAFLDLRAGIEQVNTALCHMVGLTAEELKGRPVLSLTFRDDQPLQQRLIEQCFLEGRDSQTMEKRLVRSDGSLLWVQNSVTLLRDAEGKPVGILDLCQDISALKKSEEELAQRVTERTAALEDKTNQLESFCYTVAHDLRAPLRAISGYADVLREENGSDGRENTHQYLQKIQGAAAKLDQLIHDLLGYTRVQQVSVTREDVDLTALIDQVIEHLNDASPAAVRDMNVTRPLGHVRSDPVALHHVFSNLVSNALKFTRPGVVPRVDIYSEHATDRLRLWVVDNGLGVDPRYKDRVFQMFERLHPHLDIPGTGVGLAIVSKAMERLGGACGVEPNQPHGSRFWIELPK
jgi:PAS domain S-box-containing protein